MAEVRAQSGIPVLAQFAGLGAPTLCAPLVVDTATGFIYSLKTGDVVVAAGAAGTVTSVAQTFTGGLITVAGSPITTSGTLALTVAGTSGGIPYFSGATTWASSGALTQHGVVLGGGAGAAPATIAVGANNTYLKGSAGADPAFATITLASADFANQGTTTTVLHGNAAGNPSFGAVSLTADVTGTLGAGNGGTGITSLGTGVATALGVNVGSAGAFVTFNGALGTPSSGTLTNASGTAASLTAGTVTTNANLTGPITSTGNATAIASQTGTGTKFVMDNGPTLIAPALGTPASGVLTNCTGTAASLTAGNATTAVNVSGGAVTLGASSLMTFGASSYVKAGSTFGVLINDSTDSFNRYGFPDAGTSVRWYSYGAGTATFSANGTITSVSDETYKIKDGAPEDPVAMLMKLAPGYCYWRDKARFGPQRELMFYAQNVHAAIGEEAAPTPLPATDAKGSETAERSPWGYYDRSVLAVAVLSLQRVIADFSAYKAAHP